MEGVGSTRLGRSSTRYVSTTVFSGPVRKWKKRWVEISPSSANNNGNNNNNGAGNNHNHNPHPSSHHSSSSSAASSSSSHLLLYKWTPATNGATANGTATINNGNKDDSSPSPSEEPSRRKFRYVPIVALDENQKKEISSEADEETRQSDANSPGGNRGDGDALRNSTDVDMADSQAGDSSVKGEASETSLDLNLGLKAGFAATKFSDNEHGVDSKMAD